jgi:hypothetical protein
MAAWPTWRQTGGKNPPLASRADYGKTKAARGFLRVDRKSNKMPEWGLTQNLTDGGVGRKGVGVKALHLEMVASWWLE